MDSPYWDSIIRMMVSYEQSTAALLGLAHTYVNILHKARDRLQNRFAAMTDSLKMKMTQSALWELLAPVTGGARSSD